MSQTMATVAIGLSAVIVAHVKRSTLAADTIDAKPKLQGYCKSRFDTYLIMLRSVLKNFHKIKNYSENPLCQSDALIDAVSDFQLRRNFECSGPGEISIFEFSQQIIKILEIFSEATSFLGRELTPSSHDVIPMIAMLHLKIEELAQSGDNTILQRQASIMKDLILKRYWHHLRHPTLLLASCMLPDIKERTQAFLSSQTVDGVSLLMKREQLLKAAIEAEFEPAPAQTSSPVISAKRGRYELLSRSNTAITVTTSWELELQSYLHLCVTNSETDVLQFWRIHQYEFPTLSKIAKRVLAVPASQLVCERVFSSAGTLISPNRTALSTTSVNAAIRSRLNVKILSKLDIEWNTHHRTIELVDD